MRGSTVCRKKRKKLGKSDTREEVSCNSQRRHAACSCLSSPEIITLPTLKARGFHYALNIHFSSKYIYLTIISPSFLYTEPSSLENILSASHLFNLFFCLLLYLLHLCKIALKILATYSLAIN